MSMTDYEAKQLQEYSENVNKRFEELEKRVAELTSQYELNEKEGYVRFGTMKFKIESPVVDTLTAVTEGVSSGTTMSKPSPAVEPHDCTKQKCSTCHEQHEPVPCDKPKFVFGNQKCPNCGLCIVVGVEHKCPTTIDYCEHSFPRATCHICFKAGLKPSPEVGQCTIQCWKSKGMITISRKVAEFELKHHPYLTTDMKNELRKALKEGK
jgi:hypothetical protein